MSHIQMTERPDPAGPAEPAASSEPAPAADAQRPLRADARRNREKVLAAAEELFAEQGIKVHVGDIAKRAGVGVGTVSRHFPTKNDLLDAVLAVRFGDLRDRCDTALENPDPVEAFRRLVIDTSEYQAHHKALAEEMKDGGEPSSTTLAARDDFFVRLTEVVHRAQAAGAVRDDIGPADIGLLFAGIAQAAAGREHIDSTLRERYVCILLDGLRPAERSKLPGRPLEFSDVVDTPES